MKKHFQKTTSTNTPPVSPEQEAAMKAGKAFEKLFSEQARLHLNSERSIFHRLMDTNKNAQPADYIYVGSDVTAFLELKSTGMDAFPLENIRAHQLEACTIIDKSSPNVHAGFVIQFRNHDNEVWFISALEVQKFINAKLGRYISREYLTCNAIRIPTFKLTPKAKTNRGFDFDTFFEALMNT